jgi:hypothetical protein
MKRLPTIPKTAQVALDGLHSEFGSWSKVAAHLKLASGVEFKKSQLQQIAAGKRPAPNSVLHVLGLPLKEVPAQPCAKCGKVHTTNRCVEKPTFEERAAQYDRWLARNLDKINRIVAWATKEAA